VEQQEMRLLLFWSAVLKNSSPFEVFHHSMPGLAKKAMFARSSGNYRAPFQCHPPSSSNGSDANAKYGQRNAKGGSALFSTPRSPSKVISALMVIPLQTINITANYACTPILSMQNPWTSHCPLAGSSD